MNLNHDRRRYVKTNCASYFYPVEIQRNTFIWQFVFVIKHISFSLQQLLDTMKTIITLSFLKIFNFDKNYNTDMQSPYINLYIFHEVFLIKNK